MTDVYSLAFEKKIIFNFYFLFILFFLNFSFFH